MACAFIILGLNIGFQAVTNTDNICLFAVICCYHDIESKNLGTEYGFTIMPYNVC